MPAVSPETSAKLSAAARRGWQDPLKREFRIAAIRAGRWNELYHRRVAQIRLGRDAVSAELANCPPRVRALVARAADEAALEVFEIFGKNRRQTREAVRARDRVIAALYGQPAGAGLVYGLSLIGRVLKMHHSSVLESLRRSGVVGPKGAAHE